MELSAGEILKLANLAKLSFTPDEAAEFSAEFSGIMDFANTIASAKSKSSGEHKAVNMDDLRPDISKASMPNDEVLLNAPSKFDGCFSVPRIVENK